MEDKLLLSATEVANLLGLSRPSVYQLMRRADFPLVRLGGRVFVPTEMLKKWLDRQVQNDEEVNVL